MVNIQKQGGWRSKLLEISILLPISTCGYSLIKKNKYSIKNTPRVGKKAEICPKTGLEMTNICICFLGSRRQIPVQSRQYKQ